MKYTWLVEKYLEGELSGEELQRFELEVLRNPEASKELERIRRMQKFMESQHAIMSTRGGLIEHFEDMENVIPEHEIQGDLEELKIRKVRSSERDLNEFRARLAGTETRSGLPDQKSRMVRVRNISVWVAAASLALLIVTSSLLLFGGNRMIDYQAVYDKNYTLLEIFDNNQRTPETEGYNEYRDEARENYLKQNFEGALSQFDKVEEKSYFDYLFSGISYMELNRCDKAIESFDKLGSNKIYEQYGMWYKGLCYLKLGEGENARIVFEQLASQKGKFRNRSRSIRRKLRHSTP